MQVICDRVALFNKGKVVLQGTVPELAKAVLGGGSVIEIEAAGPDVAPALGQVAGVTKVETVAAGRYKVFATRDASADLAVAVMGAQGRLIRLASKNRAWTPSTPAISRSNPVPRSREGSPWTGLSAVYFKELGDHLSSVLMRVLEWLVILSGLGAVYTAVQQLKTVTAEDRFLFLHLFTASNDALPINFISLIGFLVPLVAIGLGFDSINGEFNRRTMSRVLAQPIYRDALLFGKFLAGLSTLAISLVALFLLVIGLGLLMLGVPPNGEEVLRAIGFLVASIAYGGVWLAAAMLFSVIFRSAAAAAMCSIGLWLLLTILWPILVRFVAQAIAATPDFDRRRPADGGAVAPGSRPVARFAQHVVHGDDGRTVIAHDQFAATGPAIHHPVPDAGHDGHAAAIRPEPAAGLAAANRPDRHGDRAVRDHLCDLPTPGNPA